MTQNMNNPTPPNPEPQTSAVPDYQADDCVYNCGGAHLTADGIIACRAALDDLIIAPFDPKKAKGVGYNLSLSELIYSQQRRCMVPICRESQKSWFYLRPGETVLALSYEYIKVSDHIAGSFHSRVRTNALGIGSTSTTLDPCWNGMLLLTLNNPTRKRIPVVLSTRDDGIIKPSNIITLIVWRTTGKKDTDQDLTLHLDNPPMRIDIWTELTAEPLRVRRNAQYQKFCQLIESLAEFESPDSEDPPWAKKVWELLTALRVAIEAERDETNVRRILIELQHIQNLPQKMMERIQTLTAVLPGDGPLLTEAARNQLLAALEMAKRETEYQILCCQVAQIHTYIRANVPISHGNYIFAYILQWVRRNLGALVGVLLLALVFAGGRHIDALWVQLLIAGTPLLAAVLSELFFHRD